MVLVEHVPTSFGYVFHPGTHFSNTRPVEFRGWPLSLTHRIHAGIYSTLSHWVWGLLQGICSTLSHWVWGLLQGICSTLSHWVWGLLQGSAWSCVFQVSYDGLTIFSFRFQ